MTLKPLSMLALAMLALALLVVPLTSGTYAQEQAASSNATWLPTLITATPQEGFALAVTLARRGVGTTQPDREVLSRLRPVYAEDADSLIAASHVVAVHFQTIAAANGYWRSE